MTNTIYKPAYLLAFGYATTLGANEEIAHLFSRNFDYNASLADVELAWNSPAPSGELWNDVAAKARAKVINRNSTALNKEHIKNATGTDIGIWIEYEDYVFIRSYSSPIQRRNLPEHINRFDLTTIGTISKITESDWKGVLDMQIRHMQAVDSLCAQLSITRDMVADVKAAVNWQK